MEVLFTIILILSELRKRRTSKKILESTCRHCDARNATGRWIDTHPTIPKSHPIFQKLLAEEEEAYQNFLKYHPSVRKD